MRILIALMSFLAFAAAAAEPETSFEDALREAAEETAREFEIVAFLDCRESDVAGLAWSEAGTPEAPTATPGRYTVGIYANGKRRISGAGGEAVTYSCDKPFPETAPELLACSSGGEHFLFQDTHFTRSQIYGAPVGGGNAIGVSYGTCSAL